MACGELTRWRIFGEWVLENWHVGEYLANLWRIVCGELTGWRIFGQYLANVWRMAFGELTRWRIFGHYLANLWRIFGEWLLGNSHVGESLANSFWRTDTLANLWRIFGEWLLGK